MLIEFFRDSARLNWFILLSKFPIRYIESVATSTNNYFIQHCSRVINTLLYWITRPVRYFLFPRFAFPVFTIFFSLSRKWVMSGISTQSRHSSLTLRTHYVFYFIISTCGSSTCGRNNNIYAPSGFRQIAFICLLKSTAYYYRG